MNLIEISKKKLNPMDPRSVYPGKVSLTIGMLQAASRTYMYPG